MSLILMLMPTPTPLTLTLTLLLTEEEKTENRPMLPALETKTELEQTKTEVAHRPEPRW
jgi:hypothetical protein